MRLQGSNCPIYPRWQGLNAHLAQAGVATVIDATITYNSFAQSQCALSASRRCDLFGHDEFAEQEYPGLNAHLAQAGVATHRNHQDPQSTSDCLNAHLAQAGVATPHRKITSNYPHPQPPPGPVLRKDRSNTLVQNPLFVNRHNFNRLTPGPLGPVSAPFGPVPPPPYARTRRLSFRPRRAGRTRRLPRPAGRPAIEAAAGPPQPGTTPAAGLASRLTIA